MDSTLKAIGPGNTDAGGYVDRGAVEGQRGRLVADGPDLLLQLGHTGQPGARTPPGRSTRPAGAGRRPGAAAPAPACTTMVVQLGLATMPFGMLARASALTSGTTSGTSGSMRQADELSMTMAPAAATCGAHSRDAVGAHGEQGDVDAAVVGGGDVLDRHAVERRGRPSGTRRSTGPKRRENGARSSIERITPPTWPVAP